MTDIDTNSRVTNLTVPSWHAASSGPEDIYRSEPESECRQHHWQEHTTQRLSWRKGRGKEHWSLVVKSQPLETLLVRMVWSKALQCLTHSATHNLKYNNLSDKLTFLSKLKFHRLSANKFCVTPTQWKKVHDCDKTGRGEGVRSVV